MIYKPKWGDEGRWTKARPDCPHPERWSCDDAESTEHEVSELVGAFVRALQPDYVIETGTAWGQTSLTIGRALRRNGQGWLDTLDPDNERALYSANRCAGLPVSVFEQESLGFTPRADIDFAWFDSLCELRVPEFREYYSMMHSSTVVGFHDTGPHKPLRPELDELQAENMIQPIYLPTPRGVCFARVVSTRLKEA